jgi:hypothetical protein
MDGAMDDPEEPRETGPLRSAFTELASALAELCAVRLAMARAEARIWGKAAAWRVAMVGTALVLAVLAVLAGSGFLVAVVYGWTGSWAAAFAIVAGVELAAAAILVAAAWRAGARTAPLLSRTAREIRRDVEDLTAGSR